MYKMALSKAGYEVVTAKDGIEGMSKVESEYPDLIISDIQMPELNGYQLCRLIKDDVNFAGIPVILLTSLGQQQDRFWGIEAGASSFVTKSSDTAGVLKQIEKLLKNAPEKKPRPAVDASEAKPADGEAVQTRLNRILEKLLYQSTISNIMRDIARYAHDKTKLYLKFFSLMRQIVEYSMASVFVFSDKTVHTVFDLQQQIDRSLIEKAQQLVLKDPAIRAGATATELDTPLILNDENLADDPEGAIASQIILPLKVGQQVQGALAVFSTTPYTYTRDISSTLQLIAAELGLAIRHLSHLEEIERIKSDFTSQIIGNLRSPLVVNQSFMEALYDEHVDPITPDQKEIMGQILATNKKMINFIKDVLDISRIDTGSLDISPAKEDAADILREAAKSMHILSDQKNIKVFVAPDAVCAVNVDREKILQVITNLISNSIKFTDKNGAINLQAAPDPTEKGMAVFSVQDTGVGIPEEELTTIFERYKKSVSSITSDEKGLGLGLAICKSIVEAHHGKIWVESQLGHGSTFYFTVPSA